MRCRDLVVTVVHTMSRHREIVFHLSAAVLLLRLSAADDATVMSSFRSGLNPPPSDWPLASSHCDWPGVTCGSSDRVTSINLDSKGLSGTLPADLNSLSQLKALSLQRNNFSGMFPSLAGLGFLQEAYFDGNRFDSVPSGFLKGLSSLQTLSLTDNGDLAPWSLPADLTGSPSLVSLSAGNAGLAGSLPDFFGSFLNLQNVRLSYNNLTGSLPDSIGESGIQNLWLNNQDSGFSGTIEVLVKMTRWSQVWLQKNQFTGSIPDLSGCVNLFDLQLRDNVFTGLVPASLMSLPGLKNVSLDNNKLQGPMPQFQSGVKATFDNNKFCLTEAGPCDPQVNVMLEVAAGFGYPVLLADSWAGNDPCEGWSFVSCSQGNVVTVTLGKQHFGGTISPVFGNLTFLESLLLNDDNLTGSIPISLTSLSKLKTLDVSNNNLTGEVPSFPNVKLITTPGNLLLGKLTPGRTPSDSSSTGTGGGSSGTTSSKTISGGAIAGIVVAVLIFVLLLMFVFYKRYKSTRHKSFGRVRNPENGTQLVKNSMVGGNGMNGYGGVVGELASQSSGDFSDFPIFEGGNVTISIEVLRQVTDNFSERNILGRGGFGVVYKGELHDGTKIAVKRMEPGAMGNKGMNEFQAEIAVLTKVRHRHLVALLGYCVNGNERLLVYEYMPQGTLTQHLFDCDEHGYPPLTWKQRVSIALDVARGVEYLHSLAQQSFIHRDLKPSNILLDDNMRAKVADFGLVKNAPDGKFSVETRLAGTFGYLAPEYAATGRVTTKVDVYAYGVVLMEIITGRKALDDSMPDERAHLVTWFRRVLINKANIPKAIDQTLDPDEETMESIYKVCELAGHCTAREPFKRPDMGHAVNILGPLVEQWKPSRQEDEEGSDNNPDMNLPQALRRWQTDEGTSTMFDDFSYQSQSSIPSKPTGFSDSLHSIDGR